MQEKRRLLMSSAVIPMLVVAGMTTGYLVIASPNMVKPAKAQCSPCNPCIPFNPCAAGGGLATDCTVPLLADAAPNPCAAANPCSPDSPCNPCNPCAAGIAPDLTTEQKVTLYNCLLPQMARAYGKSDNEIAVNFTSYRLYSNQPYISANHAERYVQNYANDTARAYGAYEKAGRFPAGTKLAKPSFTVSGLGRAAIGPLFLMEKMEAGFSKESHDWRYTMIMPDGTVFGTTNGAGAANVEFCIGCHLAVSPDQDSVMLLPEEYRVN